MARYTPSGTVSTIPAINSELEAISQAFEDTLSRLGDSPNQLETDLDANGNQILNVATDPNNPNSLVSRGDVYLQEEVDEKDDATLEAAKSYANGLRSVTASELGTTAGLITGNAPSGEVGSVVRTLGYETLGDGGEGLWLKTSDTDTPSQDPATTTTGKVVDTSGVVWLNVDERPNAKTFGAKGDGATDDTLALSAFLSHLRETNKPGFIPSGTYNTTAALDISGVELSGIYQGFDGREGTIISGAGDHDILVQVDQSLNSTTQVVDGLSLRNGVHGMVLGYSLNTSVKNIYMKDVTYGLRLGNLGSAGPIWVIVENVVARAEDTGLIVSGLNWANALKFDTCFFTGDEQGGYIEVGGGFGSIAPLFLNTEFAGDGYGLVCDNVSNVTIVNGYFESHGPAVKLVNRCYGFALRDCVYGSLENTNKTGVNSFIYHESGNCRISVSGGYISLPNLPEADNLTFIQSDNPSSFFLKMTDQPTREVYSSGFSVYGPNLPNNLSQVLHRSSYPVQWTATGPNPSIGNGSLTGRYILNGSSCTVFIDLNVGSTTTFGSGNWLFSLPFTSLGVNRFYGSGIRNAEGTIALVTPEIQAGGDEVAVYTASGGLIQASTYAWASGDDLRFQITFELS